MPRGNDSIDAARELSERFKTTGNAEDLIAAQRAKRSRTVRNASLRPVDEEATAKLDYDKVAEAGEASGEIIDAKVRDGFVVFIEMFPDGRTRKGAYALEDSAAERRQRRARELAPHANLATSAVAANAASEAEAESESEAEKQRAKSQAEAQKAAAKAREEAKKFAQKQAEEAEKAEEKASDAKTSKS